MAYFPALELIAKHKIWESWSDPRMAGWVGGNAGL